MRTGRIVTAVAVVLLLTSLTALPYTTTPMPVFTSMLVTEMEQILRSMEGVEFLTKTTIGGSPSFFVRYMDNVLNVTLLSSTTVTVYSGGQPSTATAYKSMMFYSVITPEQSVDVCTKLNEWNRGHRGTRAYANTDSSLGFQADLYLEHGVTLDTIIEALKMFGLSFSLFTNSIK